MMPRCYPKIYRCIQCLSWHCQSVLILLHFDCSLDFFNFSLRGTKIHPKKPAFLRPIKSFIFLKYMTRLHLLASRISKFSGGVPPTNQEDSPCGMSSLRLLPKILYLKYLNLFENPACAFCQIFSDQGVIVVIVILIYIFLFFSSESRKFLYSYII